MFTKLLVPLDGSTTSEKVLPDARYLASTLQVPVELLSVVDIADLATQLSAEQANRLDKLIEESIGSTESYLKRIADTFPSMNVSWMVEKGRAEEAIIERAAADKSTLINLATHGRSGIQRWLLGSVAEKVLRGTTNPLLLVRATEETKSEGQATLRSVAVALDGSESAESVLNVVIELAKKLSLEIVLFRAYHIPYTVFAGTDGYSMYNLDELLASMRDEATEYLEKKTEEARSHGVEKVSYLAKEGLAADEIIAAAHNAPNSLIAMCTHGRSGVKRWVLGSITEIVVRHALNPVLVIRPQ